MFTPLCNNKDVGRLNYNVVAFGKLPHNRVSQGVILHHNSPPLGSLEGLPQSLPGRSRQYLPVPPPLCTNYPKKQRPRMEPLNLETGALPIELRT